MNLKLLVQLLIGFCPLIVSAQEALQIPLWPKGAPGFESRRNEPEIAKDWYVKNIHNPSITVYLPPKEKAPGAAVLICPGGGFRALVYNGEGKDPAVYAFNMGYRSTLKSIKNWHNVSPIGWRITISLIPQKRRKQGNNGNR